ncbi:leucine-rich repeats and immunoglobulin-like domains protein 3 [Rhagoletis pomonella]|uniref:leucine-rich repeats and immunoglobulin-like domains protein 3 n=1 Tax=Rhagoletis pomonella TaxID=28610 RepID=UPI0017846518|nr:leucine-rich repeats and immunoglobulin-like domains protein 3 [Rhagoletis pomonella]XP_036333320.1 leucine-rich repeats and immunoglobulin-like domains protein 3 [Rhagoletis pomonella]
MSADGLTCDCTVMQRLQHQCQNGQKQSQLRPKRSQCRATEVSTVTTNKNKSKTKSSRNSSSSDTSCCNINWHAKIAKQWQRSKKSMTVQMEHENNSTRTNYYNFNNINRLLIATVVLLITLSATTTTTTTTTATIMITAVSTKTATATLNGLLTTAVPAVALSFAFAPISLIGHMTLATAAAVPISSPLSALQQERQFQQQQLFAMLTKNRQGNAAEVIAADGGTDVGGAVEGVAASAMAAGFVPKHLLDLDAAAPVAADADADTSLETAGFVADDGQRYEKAVKALAAAVNSKAGGNSNDSNGSGGGGRLFGVGTSTDCPKECKCLDAYFDCGDKLLDRVPILPGYVQTLDLVGNKLNNTSVLQIRNLTELIKLTLKRNQLESVPVFSELSALKQLNLANNRIQRISSAALEALPKLKSLDLSRNFLHAIESSYFPPNNRLAHLILNSNEIGTIDEDAFQHLGDLLDLELNNNRLMTLPAGVFRTLHKLRKLSLNNNQLEINWSTFRGLSSIQKLFLKSNNIRALQDGVFYVMHAIETIELDHNGITSLSRQGLFNLTKLHHLSLSNNSISRIEPDTWEFTQSLISLDLSHNNISEFKPQHLDCLKRLRHLNLGHNKIQYLAENTFDCVKNLEDLNLRRNKLAWIIEDHGATPAFKALRKLKKLDLYGNNLKQIMSKSLSGLGNLESLNLGGNALATIQSGAFDHMPHLQKLSFKSLNFICDCELLWFQRWLRHNEQSTIGTQVQTENAVCGYPEALFDRQLLTLNANELECANSPKPTIVQEPSTQLTVKGANITMECIGISPTAASLAAADELKIKWRHDNQNIRERERGHFFTPHHSGAVASGDSYSTTETRIRQDHATNQTTIIGYLRLYNVSYANAGRYQCVVSNAFGTTYSQKFKISIGIHPTFLQIPSNLTIDSGDTARLVCSATGDPVPEIALQKSGGSDFPAATERRLQVIREENAFIITNAKPIDTGIYTCTAESAAGEIKVNATLVVNDKPQPNIPVVRKETVVGESSVLQCLSDLAADMSQPHREWFKDNKPFHLGTLSADAERYFFTSDHEILVIVNTESADSGHYRCEISDNSKTYTVQTELIVVKEELSQNMIFFGVVIVAALCVLIIALVAFALILYQRRKALKRRRETSHNANSISGAPSGLLSGSAGLIGGGARVASTSSQLLNGSRGSALDQTQLTTLNRTLLQKIPKDAQRKRPHSVGDFEANAANCESAEGGLQNAGDEYDADRHPQHLIITPTPNYQQLLQQHVDNDAEADIEHFTLTYLKRISLPDSAGVTGDHAQDHLSSKDSGTGSDTAVKRSIDDFTMSALLPTPTAGEMQQSGDSATTPVNESTPQATRRYNGGYRLAGIENSYPTDDGGDMDDADLLYAATHALGVSECDVELLDFDRHRAATMRVNDKDQHVETEMDLEANADALATERTHFLHNSNNENTSARISGGGGGGRQQHYERLSTTSKLTYPNNYSDNSFDGGGSGDARLTALGGNCKATLSTNPRSNAAHAQTVDI